MAMKPHDDPVIDVWANWWDADFFAAEPRLDALYRRLALEARMHLGLPELVAEAAAGGVGRIVLSGTAFPGSPATNDRIADIIAGHPNLFIGCAAADPTLGITAVRELRRAVETLGFCALKLFPYICGRPPNDAIYYPLYTACIDLGIPVLILTGHTAVQESSEPGRPHYLDEIALFFPELKIIAGHAGFPWTQELISLAWKHPNVYIDTSGHRPKYFPPELKHFMNSYVISQ